MKRLAVLPLTLVLAALACGGGGSSAPATVVIDIPTPDAERIATVGLIEAQVEARASEEEDLAPAYLGQRLTHSGQVQTYTASRAEVRFTEGTIVRLTENTLFSLMSMNTELDDPSARLFLAIGKIWVALTGGTMEVETPVGIASVRGSYESIEYDPGNPADPNDDHMIVTCMDGDCTLTDVTGNTMGIPPSQQSFIQGQSAPVEPFDMSAEQRDDWYAEMPAATQFAPTFTPTITDTPTVTPIPTDTVMDTPTFTPTPSRTLTPRPSDTLTLSLTATATVTATSTATATMTGTVTPTLTNAPTLTSTATLTETVAPSPTTAPTDTSTPIPTTTNTPAPCTEIFSPSEISGGKLINFDDLSNATVIGTSYQSAHGVVFEAGNTTRALTFSGEPAGEVQSAPNVAINDAVFPATSNNVPMTITFDTARTHVGFWIGNGETVGPTAVLEAFDSSGKQICSVRNMPVPEAHSEFIGVHDAAGRIVKVQLDYGNTPLSESIDDLYYAP